ncbi:MAG: hypothetical protein WCX88_04650 [Patescibacteria group bacterium]
MSRRKISFEEKIRQLDKKIKLLSIKINEETDPMIKSLKISRRNDFILKKNRIIKREFFKNQMKDYFFIVNGKIVDINKTVSNKNLKIRKANPYFCFLENKLSSECLIILFEMAKDKKISEVLYSLEEYK